MKKQLFLKLKEAFVSVLPIAVLVAILCFTPLVDLSAKEIITFFVAAVFLVIGIALFTLGAEISMTPMGKHVGSGLTKSGKISILVIVCFLLGTFITIAEPDLQILASQVGDAVGGAMVLKLVVGVSVGFFIAVAVLKIIFKKDLTEYLLFFYLMLFAVSALVMIRGNSNLLSMAFDSGGVTTGPITVPFIMALGVGIARSFGGKGAKDNSFGFVSLCSVGAVIGVLILSVFAKGGINYQSSFHQIEGSIAMTFISHLPTSIKEVSISLGLVVAFFLICQVVFLKLPLSKLIQLAIGIAYTYVGLIVFLTVVNAGFMPIGYKIGSQLAQNSKTALIIISFIMGFFVVMAEPAVNILNAQVEEITNGTVTKKSMLLGLTIGVGVAITLAIIRIIYGFSILYYLIPGYLISFALSFFVPKLYTAIAFDSGGVASGPLTSGFILPFSIGVCIALHGQSGVMDFAYGIVSMVALTPLITVQFLGFRAVVKGRVRSRAALRMLLTKEDEHIIEFN